MKKLVSLVVSLLILTLIYLRIDLPGLLRALLDCNRLWLVIGLSMVLPLTLMTAWRFQWLMPTEVRFRFAEAIGLILAASSLNMVLPSKMGDIAKAHFMRQKAQWDGGLALSLVIFEKSCDMLSLLLWCVFGLTFYPNKSGSFWIFTGGVSSLLLTGVLFLGSPSFLKGTFTLIRMTTPSRVAPKIESLREGFSQVQAFLWSNKLQALKIATVSLLLWFLHLVQIWFFILALRASTPFLANLAIAPLAILAGLVPLTFAGVGTRDAAVILLYTPFFSASVGAALGLLYTCRYLVPALGGLPFLGRYMLPLRRSTDAGQSAVRIAGKGGTKTSTAITT